MHIVVRHTKLERRAVGEGTPGRGVADGRGHFGVEAGNGEKLQLTSEERDRGWSAVGATAVDAGPVQQRGGLLAGERWTAASVADVARLARHVVENRPEAAVLGRGRRDERDLEVLVAFVMPREPEPGERRRGLGEGVGRRIEHGGGAARERGVGFPDAASVELELRVGGGVGDGRGIGPLGRGQVVLIGTGKHSHCRDGNEDT